MGAVRSVGRVAAALALIVFFTAPAGAFVIGVAPHTSARVILDMYDPLRLHLEKALGESVEVVTAPDFDEFARRALGREYDLAVTTGHQARLLQVDAKDLPLLTYRADFKAVAIVALNGGVRHPADLKGKPLLGLSPASLVTLWGLHWVDRNGLDRARVGYVSASDSVAQLVAAGEAAAGFTSLANFQKLSPELREKLKIIAESPPMAGRVYVLSHRRAGDKARIEAALQGFAGTKAGRAYFESNKLGGYRGLKAGELAAMDPYADEVRKVVGKGGK